MTPADTQYRRYQDLQRYVGWTDDDARNVRSVAALLTPHLAGLVDDFYAEIERHPAASKVITGGIDQIARLKGTLVEWLGQLLAGPYDRDYVARRWRVGWRHVEIGLDQVYTNAALSRLRRGLLHALERTWDGDPKDSLPARIAINTLLDLDLAIIEDAYQAEYHARQQRTERMAAIGQVGGGIAHELRNPLNVIKTSVYFLLNAKHPSPAKTTEHLCRIERQVTLADGVITALSNFARMPAPDLKPVSVRRVVEEAIETNPLPTGVAVTHDWSADLPNALADADQLRIAFANLVRNARDAMGAAGTLTLTGRAAGSHVEVAVADTGGGIAAENLLRVMEPLFTTKARGLGLGLALSRAILEKNQGSLRVASAPGQGTTFTIRLTAATGVEGT